MNPQEPVAVDAAQKISGAFGITIERTCVNKGRMAPAGKAFYIATYKDKRGKKKMTQLVNTKGMTEKEEAELKENLKAELIKHFKL